MNIYCTSASHLPLHYYHPITGSRIVIDVEKDENGQSTGKYVFMEIDKSEKPTGFIILDTLQDIDSKRNLLILNGWKIRFLPKVKLNY